MKVALVNPKWDFSGSIYFGCHEAHLPLELGYAAALLQRGGHEVLLADGTIEALDNGALADKVAAFGAAITVVTTAPTYLFWRWAQPELRCPAEFIRRLGGRGGQVVVVGPHGSTTPRPTLEKTKADAVVRGECEEAIVALADAADIRAVPSVAYLDEAKQLRLNGPGRVAAFVDLPPVRWPDSWVARHGHHHHRFDRRSDGPGAEVEASRGCPYACSFCAKIDFRDAYRRRALPALLDEIDGLIGQGTRYLYFIDEIFLPWRDLLEALVERGVPFGVQTRIDLWKPDMLDLLGRAGCVSIEAGVESLSVEGRAALDKNCRMTNDELAERLIEARRHVPFVQANLIGNDFDDPDDVATWRARVQEHGIWANDPVPMFPYPASPGYRKLWGEPDDRAWERAHEYYLRTFAQFSDIQDAQPRDLRALEAQC
jgi:B12-binding domain/radical SAM domain protein of rhizo-twelve system